MTPQDLAKKTAQRRQELVETIGQMKEQAGHAASPELLLLANVSLAMAEFANDLAVTLSAMQPRSTTAIGEANCSCIRVMCGARVTFPLPAAPGPEAA